MFSNKLWRVAILLMIAAIFIAACGGGAAPAQPAEEEAAAPAEEEAAAPAEEEAAAPAEEEAAPAEEEAAAETSEELVFGMLLVGPFNDRGWSQAHYEAGLYVEEKLPGTKLIYLDKVNPADRPGTTPDQLAEDLVNQGARVVIFNSDDMKDAATEFAKNNPDITVIHASGDQAWQEGENYVDLPNLGNVMPFIEPAKMMAGCAAALTTNTGKIGYLGPLINDETRRLAAAAYLGAKHCWTEYLAKDPVDLEFKVTWIGFWFNIPGVTADPTQVADDFYNTDYDVVLSGIDTTEGLVQAKAAVEAGREVWNVAYDHEAGCEEAPEVCLGVPFFNWRPFYLKELQAVMDGTWQPSFQWLGPSYPDINNLDTTYAGFIRGEALSEEAAGQLDSFIEELANGLNLWTGPLNFQDGSPYLAEGEVATEQQIWYLPQLLEGMEGQSVPE